MSSPPADAAAGLPPGATLLVTRPAEDAGPLVGELEALGFRAWVEPILRIEHCAEAAPVLAADWADAQAVLFTSANGVRAFAALSPRRDRPAYAVGASTAAQARAVGFATVHTAGGDVAALADLLAGSARPDDGVLLHVAGSVTAGDLAGRLAEHGFTVRRHVLYRAEPAARLSDDLCAALRRGEIAGALFFSPRTAAQFVGLATAAEVRESLGRMTALCLSRAVATAAAPGGWSRVAVAPQPDQGALLSLLAGTCNTDPTTEPSPGLDAGTQGIGRGMTTGGDSGTGGTQYDDAAQVAELIQRFGGIRPMATKLGISFTTVQGWKQRGHIPPNRMAEIRAAADKHGIELPAPGSPAAATAAAAPEASAAEPAEPAAAAPPPPAPEVEEPAYVATPPVDRGMSGVGVFFTAVVVVAVTVAAGYFTIDLWGPTVAAHLRTAQSDAGTAALSGLEGRVAGLEATLGDKGGADEGQIAQQRAVIERLGGDIAALSERVGRVETTVSGQADGPVVDIQALSDMDARINQLQQSLDETRTQLGALSERAAGSPDVKTLGQDLTGKIQALSDEVSDADGRQNTQLDALTERIDALESATAAAAGEAAAEAATVLAIGQLRAALATPNPYRDQLESFKSLVPGEAGAQAVAALEPHADAGVPTRAMLADRFRRVAAAVSQAALVPEGDGWVARSVASLSRLVSVRPSAGEVEGEGAGAAVARAESRLAAGDLAGAVAALEGLEGAPAAAAADWLAAAKARLAVEGALESLSADAIASLNAALGAKTAD